MQTHRTRGAADRRRQSTTKGRAVLSPVELGTGEVVVGCRSDNPPVTALAETWVRRTCVASGLAPQVVDPAVIGKVVAVLRVAHLPGYQPVPSRRNRD